MTTAHLTYAAIATIGLALGWRACFGWFRWWLAPIFAGAALWAAMLPATAQEALAGRVTHVRDSDTIVVGQQAVRLHGVHAPELDEPGGYEAQWFMAQLVAGARVECRLTVVRSLDRAMAVRHFDSRDVTTTLQPLLQK